MENAICQCDRNYGGYLVLGAFSNTPNALFALSWRFFSNLSALGDQGSGRKPFESLLEWNAKWLHDSNGNSGMYFFYVKTTNCEQVGNENDLKCRRSYIRRAHRISVQTSDDHFKCVPLSRTKPHPFQMTIYRSHKMKFRKRKQVKSKNCSTQLRPSKGFWYSLESK